LHNTKLFCCLKHHIRGYMGIQFTSYWEKAVRFGCNLPYRGLNIFYNKTITYCKTLLNLLGIAKKFSILKVFFIIKTKCLTNLSEVLYEKNISISYCFVFIMH
jgi:hypothetical protein